MREELIYEYLQPRTRRHIITHTKTGNNYELCDLVKIKSNGNWVDGAIYVGNGGTFCREVGDFSGFKHSHIEPTK